MGFIYHSPKFHNELLKPIRELNTDDSCNKDKATSDTELNTDNKDKAQQFVVGTTVKHDY